MGAQSTIEWTDASWTPIRARAKASGKLGWHCVVLDKKLLTEPLRWKKPRMVFVCSMTDLFADFVPDEWIDRMFAVMALAPQHTFQCLTKRPERMRAYMATSGQAFDDATRLDDVVAHAYQMADDGGPMLRFSDAEVLSIQDRWPLPNVWLGVSVEDQASADARIPELLATPAAVRFVSYEPALGPVDFGSIRVPRVYGSFLFDARLGLGRTHLGESFASHLDHLRLDWIIAGGESGAQARPAHPDWFRKARDDCRAAGVAFFMKQMARKAPIPADLMVREWPNAQR